MLSMIMRFTTLTTAACVIGLATPAAAQDAFVGVYVHEVDTPFSLPVNESGIDLAVGYRFAPIRALRFIGGPQPYVLASLNSAGDTSFAGGGLSWRVDMKRAYVRPGIGFVLHDGPKIREVNGRHTELGSRVLFEPELAIGYRVDERISVEASWMHISQAQLFNRRQNPGIDMIGVRANLSF